MFNETINKAYIEAHFEIEQEIRKLQETLDEHNQVSHIHWGHVSDLKYILSELKTINGEE